MVADQLTTMASRCFLRAEQHDERCRELTRRAQRFVTASRLLANAVAKTPDIGEKRLFTSTWARSARIRCGDSFGAKLLEFGRQEIVAKVADDLRREAITNETAPVYFAGVVIGNATLTETDTHLSFSMTDDGTEAFTELREAWKSPSIRLAITCTVRVHSGRWACDSNGVFRSIEEASVERIDIEQGGAEHAA